MEFILSDDGKVISGIAISKSGNWTGQIELKRFHLVAPFID